MSAVGRPNDVKKCGKCGETKATRDFSRHCGTKDGLQTQCKACQRAYRQENPEKRAATQRAYYQANRKKGLAAYREWAARNPQKVAERQHRRRTRKKGNGVYQILKKERQRLYASPCAVCGATDDIELDHIIPIKRGGQTSIGNSQPLCRSCNASKGDKLMVEWLAA